MLGQPPRLSRRSASLASPGCPVASWPQPWRSGSPSLGQPRSDLAPTVLLPGAPLQRVRWSWDRLRLQWAASAGLPSRWDSPLRLRPRSPARLWRPGPLAFSAPLPPAAAGVSVLPPASPFQLVRRQGLRLRRPLFPGPGEWLRPRLPGSRRPRERPRHRRPVVAWL